MDSGRDLGRILVGFGVESTAVIFGLKVSSTIFFNLITEQWKARNSLLRLIDDNGNNLNSRQELEARTMTYYQELFASNRTGTT